MKMTQRKVRDLLMEGCYTITSDPHEPASQAGVAAFKRDALEAVGLSLHPLAECVWQLAWARIDAGGGALSRVYSAVVAAARLVPDRDR